MVGMIQDLRSGLRVFRRAPGFATVVVLTLGVGVGAAAAVYSVVRGVLLTPLAFEEPDRLVMLWGRTPDYPKAPLTVGDYNVLARDVGALAEVSAGWGNNTLILGDGAAEQVGLGWVTPGYFDMLRVRPMLGRTLGPDDETAVLVSHDLWVRRWGADPSVVGRTVQLTDGPFEIAGVLPPGRNANLTGSGGTLTDYEVWRLQPRDWTLGDDRSVGWLRATARLRDGVTLEAAQAEVDATMDVVNASVTSRDGGTDLRVDLVPVKDDLVGGASRTLWMLMFAVCGVLLIAASNVAHLMLARAEGRGAEVAVRTALGGSRGRLVRQMLVEGAVLAGAGGLLGFMVSRVGVTALLALAPPTLPRLDEITVGPGVLAFALVATALACLLFAVVPAARASRSDVAQLLGERSGTGGPGRQRMSRALIVAEVALSLALLTSTGLLLRSLSGLARVDLGFETEGVVTFAVETPGWGSTAEEAAATMTAYEQRLRSVPGVRAVGFTNRVPLGGGLFTGTLRSSEMVAAEAEAVEASVRYVSPDYLEAVGGRLVAGRAFRSDDDMDAVLLDETAANRLWPGEDPVGRRVEISAVGEDPATAEVIGVVAPMKHAGVAERAEETFFVPMLARAHRQNFRYAAVRVTGDPRDYVDELRAAAREVDANAVLARLRTLDELYDADVASTRFAALLLSLFGGIAVLLAAVGLHGVMAFSLRQRTREIGIRVAVGAQHRTILRDALRSGAWLVLAGIGLGIVLSLAIGRSLSALLFDVSATHTPTLAASAAVLLAVGLLSAYLPARLVLRVDPAETLRRE